MVPTHGVSKGNKIMEQALKRIILGRRVGPVVSFLLVLEECALIGVRSEGARNGDYSEGRC